MKVYPFLNFPKTCVDFTTWPMNRGVVESIDGFMAISPFTRDFMRTHLQQLGWDRDVPMEVIPNAVMMPETSPANEYEDDDRNILYASGSGIWKGPHIALYAARKLLSEGSEEFTMTMLGVEGDTWIKDLVKRLEIERHVKLLPWLPRKQLGGLMARSAVALLPALTPEPLPRVPIEANLLGTPAIVSNRGAFPYTIVDGVTGLVTEPSVEAVTKCMDDALGADWNRELIARTAKERFNPARLGGDLVRFLESFV
jgi:glycosyltransferase involved in cell wall biosynthesis